MARGVPGFGIWAQQDAEDLLASPQLHGLQDGGGRQVDDLIGISHVRTELTKVASAVEAVPAADQKS